MVEKKKDAGRLDPNKSQIKGSKARTRHKLNLSTSLLHSRDMRKVSWTNNKDLDPWSNYR